ncbi:MAG: TetR/AcrR family transcriptional regulator [Polyangiaceae bacterium]
MRRDPDAARRLILDAARDVFAERSPDGVGLKDVAARAGVSHALVTHYFGTYDALVDTVLEARISDVRERAIAALRTLGPDASPTSIVPKLATILTEGPTMRLVAWALLSGRLARSDFFPARSRGLRQVADAIELFAVHAGRKPPPRETIEFALLAVLTSMFGYALGKPSFSVALGRDPSELDDARFWTFVAGLVDRAFDVVAPKP